MAILLFVLIGRKFPAIVCKTSGRIFLGKTMSTVVSRCLEFSENGDPLKVLKLSSRELGAKIPENGVRVRFLASPINPADINMIQGSYAIKPKLPAIGGNEGVARVVEKGSSVKGLNLNDWVIPSKQPSGTWREEAILETEELIKIPNDIPLLSAATLAVNPCTAYRMLTDFGGQTRPVVQNGANSGVGVAVIQLARELGIKTVNIVRKRPEIGQLKQKLTELGADYVLTEEEFIDRKITEPIWKQHGKPLLALNCVGGQATLHLTSCLDHKGKLVSYGGMSKQPMQVPVGPLIFKSIELHGFWVSKWNADQANNEERFRMLDYLAKLVKEGKLLKPDCETVKLDDFHEAMQKSMQGFSKKQIFVF